MIQALPFANRVELSKSVMQNTLSYWIFFFLPSCQVLLYKSLRESAQVFFGTIKCMLGAGMPLANLIEREVMVLRELLI